MCSVPSHWMAPVRPLGCSAWQVSRLHFFLAYPCQEDYYAGSSRMQGHSIWGLAQHVFGPTASDHCSSVQHWYCQVCELYYKLAPIGRWNNHFLGLNANDCLMRQTELTPPMSAPFSIQATLIPTFQSKIAECTNRRKILTERQCSKREALIFKNIMQNFPGVW